MKTLSISKRQRLGCGRRPRQEFQTASAKPKKARHGVFNSSCTCPAAINWMRSSDGAGRLM
jgi:hypothetical protein